MKNYFACVYSNRHMPYAFTIQEIVCVEFCWPCIHTIYESPTERMNNTTIKGRSCKKKKKHKQKLKLIYIFFPGAFALFVTQRSRQWENIMWIQLIFRFVHATIEPWSISRIMSQGIWCEPCDVGMTQLPFRRNAILWVSLYIFGLRWGLTKRSSQTNVYPIQGLSRVNLKWVYSLAFHWKCQTSDRLVLISWWLEPVFFFIFIRQTIVNWEFGNIAPFRIHKLKCNSAIGREIETFHVLLCFCFVSRMLLMLKRK